MKNNFQFIALVIASALLSIFSRTVFASNWEHVISGQNNEGSISIFVTDEGTPNESWRFDVNSYSDGEFYSFIYNVSSGSLSLDGGDISGLTIDSGAHSQATLYTSEFPGVQLHSNGYYYFPPGTTPPWDVPPPYLQGDDEAYKLIRHLHTLEGVFSSVAQDRSIMSCLGSALEALGGFVATGAAWRAAVSGFARGSISLNLGAMMVMGAGSVAVGASASALSACNSAR